jgi:hypothetical protein
MARGLTVVAPETQVSMCQRDSSSETKAYTQQERILPRSTVTSLVFLFLSGQSCYQVCSYVPKEHPGKQNKTKDKKTKTKLGQTP